MQEYDILKNCFIGRKGYRKTLDPKSVNTQRLIDNGFIEPVVVKEPPAAKRKKKVIKPEETK